MPHDRDDEQVVIDGIERTGPLAVTPVGQPPSARRYVVIEKDLAALGFFTPSSSRIKRTKAKTIRFIKVDGGKRLESSATIVPSALHGLPITSDLDKYLALQDLLRGQRQTARPSATRSRSRLRRCSAR